MSSRYIPKTRSTTTIENIGKAADNTIVRIIITTIQQTINIKN
jgi:hypothetical protein